MGKFEELSVSIGRLLDEKDLQYGDAFARSGEFLSLLYPQGLQPKDYAHALTLIRMFDKMVRIASPNRITEQENPYQDLAGYSMLGQKLWERESDAKGTP